MVTQRGCGKARIPTSNPGLCLPPHGVSPGQLGAPGKVTARLEAPFTPPNPTAYFFPAK